MFFFPIISKNLSTRNLGRNTFRVAWWWLRERSMAALSFQNLRWLSYQWLNVNWAFMSTCHILPLGSYETSRNLGKWPNSCSGWTVLNNICHTLVGAYSCLQSTVGHISLKGAYAMHLGSYKSKFIKTHTHVKKMMCLCWTC